VNKDLDFLILASDGVFDKMENEEVIETCWRGLEKSVVRGSDSLEETLQAGVQEIMSTSLAKKTQDNISVVMVSFKSLPHLQKILQKQESGKQPEKLRPVIKKQRSSSPQASQPDSLSQRAPASESKSQQQASRCI
jgi:serine/threonine protein phosphatase PrpC